MNYRQKCPTMSVAFLFPLTWVQRERQRETSEECVWWWVTPGRSRSVGGLCDGTCPAPGSGPGHCDLCLLLPAESPPGCCSLPISLGYTECIHSRSVIEFHTCHSQLNCVFHKGARAAWKKWKKESPWSAQELQTWERIFCSSPAQFGYWCWNNRCYMKY